MPIIRAARPQSNFYILDKRISEDVHLSWAARGLLVYLLGKPDNWRVSAQALVNETTGASMPSGRDAIYRILRELQTAGYVSRVQTKNEGGTFTETDYMVSEIPLSPLTENPEAAPLTVQPLTVQPLTANPTLTSTDIETRTEKTARTEGGAAVSKTAKHPDCPHQEIIALYHEILPMCPRIRTWTSAREKLLRARWSEDPKRQNLDYWSNFFTYVGTCSFLTGRSRPSNGRNPFLAGLPWMLREESFAKIREGYYEDRKND
ncbi:hypothetical protein HFK83_01535 [Ralstonia pseudosolanacearum]|uniref:hypothetical protein n=1 Tax=Ralstonia solanacearum species complex TaxID=3116862 RepID=UPI000370A555|nr:hypothetical protein [Ralstonia pseudosolanacearum]MCK4121067.1 hypothetical protein [Ralstonia pseudosolanacearum]